jgi:hypothetical protein
MQSGTRISNSVIQDSTISLCRKQRLVMGVAYFWWPSILRDHGQPARPHDCRRAAHRSIAKCH